MLPKYIGLSAVQVKQTEHIMTKKFFKWSKVHVRCTGFVCTGSVIVKLVITGAFCSNGFLKNISYE